MNPSYSSGPTNSGGQPGMVASGPDSNVPQGVDGGGSSGGFNFSNFLNNVPKKWLAIGAGALVVILVVVVVVMGMGGKGGQKKQDAPRSDEFYKYANYLLNGTESTDTNIGDYNSGKDYAVMKAVWGKNSDYFTKAMELWNTYYTMNIPEDGLVGNDKNKGEIVHQNTVLDFVSEYAKINDYTTDELLDLYIKNGGAKAKTAVENNYKTLSGSNYEYGKTYIIAKAKASKTLIELYTAADAKKCISNGALNEACLQKNEKALSAISDRYESEKKEINQSTISYVLEELVRSCFAMRDNLGGNNG